MAEKPKRTFLLKSERMGCYKDGKKIAQPQIGGKPKKFTKAELTTRAKAAGVEDEIIEEEVVEEEETSEEEEFDELEEETTDASDEDEEGLESEDD